MQAVVKANVELIEYLLLNGANPTLCDDRGESALTITDDKNIIDMLEEAVKVARWTKLKQTAASQRNRKHIDIMISPLNTRIIHTKLSKKNKSSIT